MKLLILGHGEHGKDTVACMLRDLCGITFRSSSEAACEIAVFPYLSEIYGYDDWYECYADRRNHREEWRYLITEYNTPDKAKLCREIIATNDCYVGMRCPLEYAASKPLFDAVIWVDAGNRKPLDPSMGIAPDTGMIWIDNSGTLPDLRYNVEMTARATGWMR
jgi:hypothetical protein